jgi:hypothetical protein
VVSCAKLAGGVAASRIQIARLRKRFRPEAAEAAALCGQSNGQQLWRIELSGILVQTIDDSEKDTGEWYL